MVAPDRAPSPSSTPSCSRPSPRQRLLVAFAPPHSSRRDLSFAVSISRSFEQRSLPSRPVGEWFLRLLQVFLLRLLLILLFLLLRPALFPHPPPCRPLPSRLALGFHDDSVIFFDAGERRIVFSVRPSSPTLRILKLALYIYMCVCVSVCTHERMMETASLETQKAQEESKDHRVELLKCAGFD